MKTFTIFDVKVHWSGQVPERIKNLIKKHKDLLSSVGLTLIEFYFGETEWMIVSNGEETIKIQANFNKIDGSWITINETL